MSSLSGSGTSALFEFIMATLRCQKSRIKGDLYSLVLPRGTETTISVYKMIFVRSLTSVVPMALDIPVGMFIFRRIRLVASDFHLLEAPSWKSGARSSKVAPAVLMPNAQASRQAVYPLKLFLATSKHVVDGLNHPVIVDVADCSVAVARDFVVILCERSSDGVRVQLSTSRGMYKPNDVTVD